jgi:3-carboxy-cis,cis-muconate cycloisomerase
MLQLKRATALLRVDVCRIVDALAALAAHHIQTPAIGRTLLQDALPISLGLRLAQWRAGIVESLERLDQEVALHAQLQLGGAAGTRAGLSGRGEAITRHMARALDLEAGEPWHTRRSGVAGIAAATGILLGALGKMARDVSLLAQNRIAEVHEPAIAGRGGSSAMAHKRNPTGSQVALSAALRAPGLVATMLAGLPAEQERGLGGWQAEGPVLAELFQLAAASAEAMAQVAEALDINDTTICANLWAADVGNDIGESAAITAALLAIKPKG